MITRNYSDLLTAWRGMVEELAYSDSIIPLRWGVCRGYPDIVCVDIEDMLKEESLSLGMASFTKSRWTRFLRRYFREDLDDWIEEAMAKLMKYPGRPFVASYSVNLNHGHNYGGCLSSLQIRISPTPQIILYSRACQIDKIGFLDICLMHVIAKRVQEIRGNSSPVKGTWIISNGFISGISQIFYLKYFKLSTKGHRLETTMKRLTDVDYEDIKFGPLKRGRKRMMALDENNWEIPKSVLVSKLTLKTNP